MLVGNERELSSRSIVLTTLFVERTQADEASLNGLAEHHALQVGIVFESAFVNGVAPFLTIVAHVDFVVLNPAVAAAGTRLQRKALHVLRFTGVEVYPVGILGQGDRVHGVPDRVDIAVDHVLGIAAARFL